MLNIRSDIPIKEEALENAQEIFAQIRDLTLEAEQVLKMATQERILLTREEAGKVLRCDPKKIPRGIPVIRIGRNWLFDQKDVYAFIDNKKIRKPH